MSSRNWLLKYLKLVTALWVGCPPPNGFVKGFLLLLIKYFIAIYLDFCYLKKIDI